MTGDLLGHSNGPGIAAGMVLLNLIDALVKKGVLSQGEVANLLAVTDAQIAQWGEANIAVRDARKVLDKMRGLGA